MYRRIILENGLREVSRRRPGGPGTPADNVVAGVVPVDGVELERVIREGLGEVAPAVISPAAEAPSA